MKAAEARKLKVGDWVMGCYGTTYKRGQIVGIAWPNFTIRLLFSDGTYDTRTRRYSSLYRKTDPVELKGENLPAWLTWDKPKGESNGTKR